MNIHPIFVHFPVALLTLYAVMEVLQLPAARASHAWQIVKSVFVVIGAVGAVAAYQTGDWATEGMPRAGIVAVHATWASIAVTFFVIVAGMYVVRFINTEAPRAKDWMWNTRYVRTVWEALSRVTDWIVGKWWVVLVIGIVALALISIVGALGGAVAYGTANDPMSAWVVNLLM